MAAQKKSRTSKTSHVLSLLSGAGVPIEPQTEEKEPAEKQAAEQLQEQRLEKGETATQKSKPSPSNPKEQPSEQPSKIEEPAEEQEEPVQESAQESAPGELTEPAPRRTLTPPIVEVARANNEMLAETIKNALNEALEEEITQQEQEETARQEVLLERERELAPKPEPVSTQETEQQTEPPSPAHLEELPLEQETVHPPEAEILPPDWEPSPVMEQESAPPKKEPLFSMPEMPQMPQDPQEQGRLPDGSIFINVMELLVEEKMDRYVRLFGLCDCLRCLADIEALTLTHLPAKYVVLEENTRVPMLSFYEAQYEDVVIPEIIHACKTVMEHPRHKI